MFYLILACFFSGIIGYKAKFLFFLRFEKKISDDHPDKDNFFSIIESSRDLLTNNDWWQLKEEHKISQE